MQSSRGSIERSQPVTEVRARFSSLSVRVRALLGGLAEVICLITNRSQFTPTQKERFH
jgi:hypothetical protein